MAIKAFVGFETGDAGEMESIGSGSSIQTGTVRSGAYAIKQAGAKSFITTLATATQQSYRAYFRFPTALPTATSILFLTGQNGGRRIWNLSLASSGKIILNSTTTSGLTTVTGTTVLSADTWYNIGVAYAASAGGAVNVSIDDVSEMATTHSNAATGAPNKLGLQGATTPNEYFFDDIRLDIDTLTIPVGARIIARQGKAGAPSDDAWTKNNATDANLCWSQTPFSTATNCSNAVNSAAQTMLVAAFSATQTGHGTETVATGDTINICKSAVVAKAALGSTAHIRRYVIGVLSSATISLTTADTYFEDGEFWNTSVTGLDSLEVGMAHAADVNLEDCSDCWMMTDYSTSTSAAAAAAFFRKDIQFLGTRVGARLGLG